MAFLLAGDACCRMRPNIKEKEKQEKEDEIDWEEILLNGFEAGGTKQQYEELEYQEPVSVETPGLIEHLREQLQMQELTPRELLLSEEFLGNITDDGYLGATLDESRDSINVMLETHAAGEAGGPDPEEDDGFEETMEAPGRVVLMGDDPNVPTDLIGAPARAAASDSGDPRRAPKPRGGVEGVPYFTDAEVDKMLAVMQRLDPPGIGARDLRECLLLQLRDAKEVDTLSWRLVSEAFPDLIAHRWNELAKRFGTEPGKVQAAADALAKFDPKPGLKHANRSDGYIIPDLIVEKVGGKYHVTLNDTGMPRLRVSRAYQDVARDKKKLTAENREFIANKMNSANWMIQAIEQRRQTMLKVMNFIVDRQRAFFEKGVEYLKPLTLREVAEVISMHESTVSRVTNEKYVQTPRGVLPLKFFFSSALTTASGEDASARSIRAKLQKMVQEEDPAKPLTDQQIVHLFQEQGIQIARRTVAKYRDQLGILPARMRKRV
jgi:RNA polymerase sigma-54 factor